MTGNVIVLELNELCPPILDRMVARGELPNFFKLHRRSDVYVSWANEREALEPWVQWVTLHTGKTQDIHGAKELDEGHKVALPRVWDMLGEQGISSLVFGSMNADRTSERVFLVPDPWSMNVAPSDPSYQSFHEFISFFVTEHTNARAKLSRAKAVRFVRYMLMHGLSLRTLIAIARQLLNERTSKHDLKWRRALILDLLMWDVFSHEYRRLKPAFATFFANSTAFLQHRYWRHMEPEAYQVKPSAEEMAAYGDAIEASYCHMDMLVGRAMELAGNGGRIVFASALSQEANLRYEAIGGKFVYRAHDFAALNRWAGGPENATFEPVMAHQSWASFETEKEAMAFEATLLRIQANGETAMEWRRDGTRVLFWCKFISKVAESLQLTQATTGATIAFSDMFAPVGQINNSQHHRDGAFWVERADGSGQVHPDKLPLEQATSLLLGLFPAKIIGTAIEDPLSQKDLAA